MYALQKDIPTLTRSSLHRCLQRHSINRPPQQEAPKPTTQKFKTYPPGNIHIDITQVHTKKEKLYLLVTKDHTTKYCIAKPYKDQTRATAIEFLQKVIKDYPCKITKILTNNSLQFTHRPEVKKKHTFTSLCKAHGIAHRLTKPYHPCTNGQVERMNKTLKQTTVDKYYYKDYDSLQKHLNLFLKAYHNAKHLRSLQGNTPFEQLCIFYHKHKQFYRFYLLDMFSGLYT